MNDELELPWKLKRDPAGPGAWVDTRLRNIAYVSSARLAEVIVESVNAALISTSSTEGPVSTEREG